MNPLILAIYALIVPVILVILFLFLTAGWGFYRTYERRKKMGATKTRALLWGIGGGALYYFVPQIILAIIIIPVRVFIFDYSIIATTNFSTIPNKSFVLISKYNSSNNLSQGRYILLRNENKLLVALVVGIHGDRYTTTNGFMGVCTDNVTPCTIIKNDEILVAYSYPITASTTMGITKISHIFGKVVSQ